MMEETILDISEMQKMATVVVGKFYEFLRENDTNPFIASMAAMYIVQESFGCFSKIDPRTKEFLATMLDGLQESLDSVEEVQVPL